MVFACERDRQLFQLQLRVAQRADELALILGATGQCFELWRQAESELWNLIGPVTADLPCPRMV